MSNAFADIIKEHTGGRVKTYAKVISKDAELVQEMEKDLEERLTQKSSLYTPDSIYASQVYKECPRKWWLLKQAGQQHESMSVGCGLNVCFDIGHALHRMAQTEYFGSRVGKFTIMGHWKCQGCGTMYHSENNRVSSYPSNLTCCKGKGLGFSFVEPFMRIPIGKLPLIGSCDGVLAVDNDPWATLEIKTANEWSYNQDPESWSWWPGYLWQAHAYMKGFGLGKTVFMIINKAKQTSNVLPIKFKLVEFDEDIWKEVENRALVLNEIQNGDWDGYKMASVQKVCKAGSIDKNCPVALECSKGIV